MKPFLYFKNQAKRGKRKRKRKGGKKVNYKQNLHLICSWNNFHEQHIGVFDIMWSIDKEFSTKQRSELADDQGNLKIL